MFDPIGALYHHQANPEAGECLASLPLRGWSAKHLAQLSPVTEGFISHFQSNSYYCTESKRHFRWRVKWHRNGYEGVTWELKSGFGQIYIVPANHFGYTIFVKSDRLQKKHPDHFHHVLTTADTAEAIIATSNIDIAKKIAIPAFQRAWVGNCHAPLPGIMWRALTDDRR